jgi:hypothetical protein
MVISEEASFSYAPGIGGMSSSPLDFNYVGSSYFGLKQVVLSHCPEGSEYFSAVEEDPALFAAFCKNIVTRDDDPSFGDVRKKYTQLAGDLYACMGSIPEGQTYELSRSPKIRVSRFFEDALVEFGESRANLKELVAGKQYSELVVLLAHFIVENDGVAESAQPQPSAKEAYASASPKDTYDSLMTELEQQRALLVTLAKRGKLESFWK